MRNANLHIILHIISNVSTAPLRFTYKPVDGLHILNSYILHNAQENLEVLGVKTKIQKWTEKPVSMGFSRQEYWSGLTFLPPGDPPDPEIEPVSPASLHWQADSLPLSHLGSPLFCRMSLNLEFLFLTNKLLMKPDSHV